MIYLDICKVIKNIPYCLIDLKLDNFDIIKPLGKGAYGEVVLAKNKHTRHESALNVLDKTFLDKV